MRLVDSVVLQQHSFHAGWNSSDSDLNVRAWGGKIVFLVVPEHDGGFTISLGCEHVYVRSLGISGLVRADFDKIVERNYGCAARFNAVAGHETRHAEEIEDRLVDAVGRE